MSRAVAFLFVIFAISVAHADERFISLTSTTSTQDSGLFDYILPIFKSATGIDVHVVAVVAVGTGHALAIGQRGDADALLVHDRVGEDKFVADGFGIDRRDVMYNDFMIVGPNSDPAHIRGLKQDKGDRLDSLVAGLYASLGLMGIATHGGERTHAHWVSLDMAKTDHLDSWGLKAGSFLLFSCLSRHNRMYAISS
jgi:hypothetical protein